MYVRLLIVFYLPTIHIILLCSSSQRQCARRWFAAEAVSTSTSSAPPPPPKLSSSDPKILRIVDDISSLTLLQAADLVTELKVSCVLSSSHNKKLKHTPLLSRRN